MQPDAMTSIPPRIIKETKFTVGGEEGVSHRDHPAGIRRISLPVGLFQRSKLNKVRSLFVNR